MAAITMKVVPQLSVVVDNVPGELAKICEVLAQKDINVMGLSCTEAGSKATWHIVADKTEEAKTALTGAGYKPVAQNVFAFLCPDDRPGVLAKITGSCRDAGVNISNIYIASTGLKQPAMVYMFVEQAYFAKAKDACAGVL